MYESFSRKSCVDYGWSQGIGEAIAQAFSHHEVRVVIADRDQQAGKECEQWLHSKGGEATFLYCDVADADSIQSLINRVIDRYQRLDFLINNAGVSRFKPMSELSVAEFDEVFSINLRSAFVAAKFAAPYLREQQGSIINIASTRALMSEPNSETYAASKGGLVALTHALAVSLGPKVRVNAISPGWIEVRDWQKSSEREEVHHSEADRSQHPVGRVGTPEDVGRAAIFLCSGESGFITGQNLVIDGGMTVKMIYED